jgi:hypothetical protein
MRRTPKRNIAAIAATALAIATGANAQQRYGIGRTAMPAKIADWNIDIGRDGSGCLPEVAPFWQQKSASVRLCRS